MSEVEKPLSWDDEVEQPKEGGEFITLPAGTYPFTVAKFERGQHNGSEKLPACPKAIVTIEVDGGDHGTTFVTRQLFLHTKMTGFICEFLNSVGLRKHGEKLDLKLLSQDTLLGLTGTVHLKTRMYEGREQNDVKAFLEPTDSGQDNGHSSAAPVTDGAGGVVPF